MTAARLLLTSSVMVQGLLVMTLFGCVGARTSRRECPSPVSQGLNVRDMIDRQAQDEIDAHIDLQAFEEDGDRMRKVAVEQAKKDRNPNAPPMRERAILCLSGGGSFGVTPAAVTLIQCFLEIQSRTAPTRTPHARTA